MISYDKQQLIKKQHINYINKLKGNLHAYPIYKYTKTWLMTKHFVLLQTKLNKIKFFVFVKTFSQ